jgi:hypothetical protein
MQLRGRPTPLARPSFAKFALILPTLQCYMELVRDMLRRPLQALVARCHCFQGKAALMNTPLELLIAWALLSAGLYTATRVQGMRQSHIDDGLTLIPTQDRRTQPPAHEDPLPEPTSVE